jgi:RNA polymerase sigma-54 factor
MLSVSVEELTEGLGALEDGTAIEVDEVVAVLKRIQQFDPPGVAARDLGECLPCSFAPAARGTPWREAAGELVAEHLDLLAAATSPASSAS